MKKILVLSITQSRGSGAERVLEYLLGSGGETLAQQLIIVAPKNSALESIAKKLSYEWLPWESSEDSFVANFRAFLKLARKGELGGVGIFHAWAARSFEWAVALAWMRKGIALGTLHDSPEAFFHGGIRRWIIRVSIRAMRACVCVSDAVLKECSKLGFGARCRVVHNGLPEMPPNPPRGTAMVEIGFLGTQFAWKGMEVLAEVIAQTAHLPVHWNLFGGRSPETEATLEGILQTAGDRVTYHGFESASTLFQKLDIVFHPSIEFDPLPTVLIESARAGIPVVASRVGGAEEIVVQGETGFLVGTAQVAEAVRRLTELVQDSTLRSQLGSKARARFETEFRVERMLKGYLELWSQWVPMK